MVYTSSGKAVEIFKCKHCHRMIAYVYDDEMVREPTEIEKKMWLSEPDSLAEMMKKKAKEPNEKPKS